MTKGTSAVGKQDNLALRIQAIRSAEEKTTGCSSKPKRLAIGMEGGMAIGMREGSLCSAMSMNIAQLIRMLMKPPTYTKN